jgi:hypothetical protein
VRRIRRKAPDAFILVSLLNESDKSEQSETAQISPGTELVTIPTNTPGKMWVLPALRNALRPDEHPSTFQVPENSLSGMGFLFFQRISAFLTNARFSWNLVHPLSLR